MLLDMYTKIMIAAFAILVVILLIIFSGKFTDHFRRSKHHVTSKRWFLLKPSFDKAIEFPSINILIDWLARKLFQMNKRSFEKNKEYAFSILTFLMATILVVIPFLYDANKVWYINISFIVLFVFFVYMMIEFFIAVGKIKFVYHLPKVYKLLSDRIDKFDNVTELIRYCSPDFSKSVNRDMEWLIDIFHMKDRQTAEDEFDKLKSIYSDFNYTTLLILLSHANTEGFNSGVRAEFIENNRLISKKNEQMLIRMNRLFSTTVFMTLLVIGGLFVMPRAVEYMLEEQLGTQTTFYTSLEGYMLFVSCIAFYFVSLFYIKSKVELE